jgi:hypothetical protein
LTLGTPRLSGNGQVLLNTGFSNAAYVFPTNGGPVATIPSFAQTYAGGLSYDGTVAAGTDQNQDLSISVGWRWTASGGRQNLAMLAANAISGDGNTVLGGDTSSTALVWHNGTYTHLQSPAAANNPFNIGIATNYDGSIVVGRAGVYPTIWHNGQGAILPLVSGFTNGRATDLSSDGGVIVGIVSPDGGTTERVFVWTPARGSELITTYFASFGIDLSNYIIYNTPFVSADGRTFGLTGQSRIDSSIHGIIVTVPAPGAASALALGCLALVRRRR